MPKRVFKKLLLRTSRKNPYIGFVIEPYCIFLFFRLKDIERAKAMLPERYELVASPLFADEEPGYYQGMGIFNTKGSTFWGTRLESYLIARDRETGLVSWVFIDIISNTIIASPRDGVADRNSSRALHTTNSKGEIFIDISEDRTGRAVRLRGKISGGVSRPLDQPLWIGGNTSVAHSRELGGDNDEPFAVIFDPAEVASALDIPVGDILLEENALFPGLAEPDLCRVICFPYTQHYIADSPGCRTYIKDESEMVKVYNRIADLPQLTTFSTAAVKKALFVSVALSALANVVLLSLLLWAK